MYSVRNGADIEASGTSGSTGAAAATTESSEIRWALFPMSYVILSVELFLTAVVVAVLLMCTGTAGCGGAAQTILHCTINIISIAICMHQSCMDWICVNGDLVFNNFLLVAKLASCFKLYFIGYDAIHTKGSETVGFVCLLGCLLHWFAILYHLLRKYRTWIHTKVLGMISVMVAGVCLLCHGMVIHDVWHTHVVPVIIIFIVLVDGGLLIHAQVKKIGGNEQSLCDLVIKIVEITISTIRLVDSKGQTHYPWNAEEVLHLVGSNLTILIEVCVICFMVYNVRTLFLSKLIKWRGKIAREDDNVEEQVAEEVVVDVEQVVLD